MFRIEGSPRHDNAVQSYGIQRELNLFSPTVAIKLTSEAIVEVS